MIGLLSLVLLSFLWSPLEQQNRNANRFTVSLSLSLCFSGRQSSTVVLALGAGGEDEREKKKKNSVEKPGKQRDEAVNSYGAPGKIFTPRVRESRSKYLGLRNRKKANSVGGNIVTHFEKKNSHHNHAEQRSQRTVPIVPAIISFVFSFLFFLGGKKNDPHGVPLVYLT